MANLKKVELENLSFHSENDTHWRFYCPFCPPHDPDRKGKLYINKFKKLGFCFRCETRVIANGGVLIPKKKTDPHELISVPKFSIDSFTPISCNSGNNYNRVEKYILSRRISLDTAARFDVLSAHLPDRVVFVNRLFVNNLTDFIQFRYIDPTQDGQRFFIPRGCKKELCWIHKLRKNIDTIVISEGFFSALSVYEHTCGSLDVLVSVGKHLSDYQLSELKTIENLWKKELCLFCEPDVTFDHVMKTVLRIKRSCLVGKLSLIVSKEGDANEISKDRFEKLFCDRVDVSGRGEFVGRKLREFFPVAVSRT